MSAAEPESEVSRLSRALGIDLDKLAAEPRLDLTKIAFPSDRLTIQNLRQLFPNKMDIEFSDLKDLAKLDSMLRGERSFASLVYAAAKGPPVIDPSVAATPEFKKIAEYAKQHLPPRMVEPPISETPLYKGLIEDYVEFGLASGPHHAEQLLRDIESQARTQARSQDTPPRP
jgi:hypothetical protein